MFDTLFFLIYLFIFIITWWIYFGYLIFIFLRAHFNPLIQLHNPSLTILPTISVLIPCKDEEDIIEKKIKNSIALDYPRDKLSILFIDGGSKDKTTSIIKRYSHKYKFLQLHQAKIQGKIHQLNEILPTIHNEIILCTDADGMLDKNSLLVVAAQFQDQKLGVVGLKTTPSQTLSEEEYFWEQQNRLRIAESKYHSPLYIIAVCYAFRNGILEKFPEDVIADDIYTSFLAIKKGYQVCYTDLATAQELRCPTSYKALFYHKIRKTNAFIKEIFRFFFPFIHTPLRWKIIFYTRTAQVLIGPLFLISLGLIFSYVAFTSITWILPSLTILTLTITYLFIRPMALIGMFNKIRMFLFIQIILLYTLFTYFFYQQTSNYKKTS